MMLQGNIDVCLHLFADFGIDEENDAEARAGLDDFTNGDRYQQRKDDPLNDARDEAQKAFETTKADESLKAYTSAVSNRNMVLSLRLADGTQTSGILRIS